MSPKPLKLLEGAIFLSDAHYSFKHKELYGFLKAVATQQITTPQLVLMGDIFDLLFGGIPYTVERNREAVDLINTLSDNIEIVYLEGNHDFNLAPIFPGVKIFSIKEQPVVCEFKGQPVALAHGDFDAPFGYRFYTAVIRNPVLLRFLSLLDTIGRHFIIDALDTKLERKNDCHKMDTFESYVARHLSQQDLSRYTLFIEGHHHQDYAFMIDDCRYVNLPAFACGLGYMRFGANGLDRVSFASEEV
ncbi:UDP-2,3-diacylglucosamine diphosphatase [bacterium]|jgi:UDP-2,3-diacylglucosamine hydrolase|nr:UDP-2,3-diacylglucosamine diphosphatase [bacterium]